MNNTLAQTPAHVFYRHPRWADQGWYIRLRRHMTIGDSKEIDAWINGRKPSEISRREIVTEFLKRFRAPPDTFPFSTESTYFLDDQFLTDEDLEHLDAALVSLYYSPDGLVNDLYVGSRPQFKLISATAPTPATRPRRKTRLDALEF